MYWTKIIIFSVFYLSVSILFYRIMAEVEDSQRRAGKSGEFRTPKLVIAISAALWPLQIIGLLIYMMKG